MGRKLLNALPAIAFLCTFGVFLVQKNFEALSVAKSPRGVLTIAVIMGGYVGIWYVVRRFSHRAWIAPVVLTAVILGLAAWLVRPYYDDITVNRQLITAPVADPAPLPAPTPEALAPAPATATLVAGGELVPIDHTARGDVSLVRGPDGQTVVRFSDFYIERVPDPRLYIVEGDNVRDASGTDLGHLPGNTGDVLDVAVPDDVEAGAGWTVLVWCRAFGVPVANTTLT